MNLTLEPSFTDDDLTELIIRKVYNVASELEDSDLVIACEGALLGDEKARARCVMAINEARAVAFASFPEE